MDERMRRDVALKRLTVPGEIRRDVREQLVARMEREAHTAEMLNHSGIVTVHDMFSDEEGVPWTVMELIRGPSLQKLVDDRGRLPA